MLRLTLLLLVVWVAVAAAVAPLPSEARSVQLAEIKSLNEKAVTFYRDGKVPEAAKLFALALEKTEQLYPRGDYPNGHGDLAASFNNLAVMYQALGDLQKAEPLYRRALEMRQRLYPKSEFPRGNRELANSLTNLAFLLEAQTEYRKAETLYCQALEMYEALYPRADFPQGHPELALGMSNLGMLFRKQGEHAKAEPLLRRALEIREALYPKTDFPNGHPDLARSINNLAAHYLTCEEFASAEALYRRLLAMNEALYPPTRFPDGHPALARSINNLAVLHHTEGEFAKAEPLFLRALEMREKLYPKSPYANGHPDLSSSLTNLGDLYRRTGKFPRAETFFRRAVEMDLMLYPRSRYLKGHPDLVTSINNLASLYMKASQYPEAEKLYRQTLAMNEGLYSADRFPDGHPDLSLSLIHLAAVSKAMGEYGKAEQLLLRAQAMLEKRFPKAHFPLGHTDLAHCLATLASLAQGQGDFVKAASLAKRALEMESATTLAIASYAAEATTLNHLASLKQTRAGYLTITMDLTAADSYAVVWQTKAAITRAYAKRSQAILSAMSAQDRAVWQDLLTLRRERERLLLAPVDVARARTRAKRLAEIEEEIREKDRQLPVANTAADSERKTLAEFCKALPVGVAFVDYLRYTRFEQDLAVKGARGEKQLPCYAAFIVTRDGVARVEFKDAVAIDGQVNLWRRAITEGSPSESDYAAKVHSLIWAPVRKHLPAKVSMVYIAPEAGLHGLPWAALRDGERKRVLIEDHAVATIPHGPMLLGCLTCPKRKQEGNPVLLAMGDVSFDKTSAAVVDVALRSPAGEGVHWEGLPNTRKELDQITALAKAHKILRRDGVGARVEVLLKDLPQAHIAHLATHGFFADKKFRTAFQLDENLFGRGAYEERRGAGARSPLVLSGLVCAGANAKETPNRGILTAEAIVGLDLRKMDLAVLSACETGLGDVAGGEGVYGLTRAFHVAGCRNVCASLWQVEDEATAALMVLFYSQMWGKEPVPPAEALRRAQVALMREPERIKEWSAGRGPLPRPVAGGGKAFDKTPNLKATKTRTWAGFILSGPAD